MASETRVSELGEEKRCTRCLEFWPNDEEFFAPPSPSHNVPSTRCRACVHEIKTAERARHVERRQERRHDPILGPRMRSMERANRARRVGHEPAPGIGRRRIDEGAA